MRIGSRFLGALIGAVLGLAGCGGGGSGGGAAPNNAAQTGQVTVGITDAAGDFLTYLVDVRSIKLERANGDVVETVPLSTRIDFAELTDLTELLTVATVPSGTYRSVTMTLDFTNAEIVVEDEDGNPLEANAVDVNGAPLGTLDVKVELASSDVVTIAPGVPAHVTLDFDLDASNDVTFAGGAATVTVQPFVLVTPAFDADREHRVRGLLKSVNEANGEVTLDVRPFRRHDGAFGRFTFDTADTTHYEIDGTTFVGEDGLAALADMPVDTRVVAQGTFSGRIMTADVVLAGTSVPGADQDVVRGIVSARVGNELTVKGALVDFDDEPTAFRGTIKVLVGDGTHVSAPLLEDGDMDISAVSVGTRIVAAGVADGDVLDATEGRVHVSITDLSGRVVRVSPLVVDLATIDGLRPASFDFTGTGIAPTEDADPEMYQVDTGSLVLGTLAVGDFVRVRGLVTAFGAAPPDFRARTVIDVDLDSRLGVFFAAWPEGTNTPFTSMSPTRLDLDLSDARHSLKLIGVPFGVEDPDELALTAPTGGGIYAVIVRGEPSIRLFRRFSEMVDAVSDALDEGDKLRRLTAAGSYNSSAHELAARRVSVELAGP